MLVLLSVFTVRAKRRISVLCYYTRIAPRLQVPAGEKCAKSAKICSGTPDAFTTVSTKRDKPYQTKGPPLHTVQRRARFCPGNLPTGGEQRGYLRQMPAGRLPRMTACGSSSRYACPRYR